MRQAYDYWQDQPGFYRQSPVLIAPDQSGGCELETNSTVAPGLPMPFQALSQLRTALGRRCLKRHPRRNTALRRSVCVTLHKNAGFTADTNTSSKSKLAPQGGANKGAPPPCPSTGTETNAGANEWNFCQTYRSLTKPQGDLRVTKPQGVPVRQSIPSPGNP